MAVAVAGVAVAGVAVAGVAVGVAFMQHALIKLHKPHFALLLFRQRQAEPHSQSGPLCVEALLSWSLPAISA